MSSEKRFTAGAGSLEVRLSQGTLNETSKVGFSEEVSNLRIKIWFKNTGTLKKGGFSFLFRSAAQMRRLILVLPGQIAWIKCDAVSSDILLGAALKVNEKSIAISANLCAALNKKEVTLDYPNGNGVRKTIFQFHTDVIAQEFYQTVLTEKSRSYIVLSRLTTKQEEALNITVRALIASGDTLLEKFYFSLLSQNSMIGAVETLFANYVNFVGAEDPSLASFARLLSMVVSDPALYILFLCFAVESTQSMLDKFKTSSWVQVFDAYLTHVHAIVSKSECGMKRNLLLKQFQYPITTTPRSHVQPGSAGEYIFLNFV